MKGGNRSSWATPARMMAKLLSRYAIATGLGTLPKQYDQATSRKDAERTFRERKGNILSQLYVSLGTQLIVARQP